MQAYHVIGTAAPRVDGVAKTTGAARYAADTDLPGMLWMKALRSPYPHARIISIDTSRAQRLPGVHAVLTGADVAGVLYGRRLRDVPALAHERVRFVGERVAAVAASDAETAQRAVDLISVVYEELPAVLEPEDALAIGAPLLHPDVQTYHGLPAPLPQPTNAFVNDVWGRGDPERGFAEADLVIEGVYTTQRVHQAYLEPHSCVVWIDNDDRLQIWAPNKAPHRLKLNLADALGLDPERIVVRHSTIGGDFGGKGSPMDTPVCYFLAQKTGRPVKSVMTFAEEFSAANPRHPSVVRMRTGVKRDGALTAHEARFLFNSGAYGGIQARTGRQPARRKPRCRALPHPPHTHRGRPRLHQYRPRWLLPRAGRGAGQLRHRIPHGCHCPTPRPRPSRTAAEEPRARRRGARQRHDRTHHAPRADC